MFKSEYNERVKIHFITIIIIHVDVERKNHVQIRIQGTVQNIITQKQNARARILR